MKKTNLKKATAIVLIVLFVLSLVAFSLCQISKTKKYLPLAGEENPALSLAIMSVESNFREDVVSKKGAVGLMQVMPKTAKWCCEMMGEDYAEENLFCAKYNAKIGNYYLSYLQKKFPTRETAICAYNAGEGNVAKWMREEKTYKNGKLTNIPFQETKKYLEKVNKRYAWYSLWISLLGK